MQNKIFRRHAYAAFIVYVMGMTHVTRASEFSDMSLIPGLTEDTCSYIADQCALRDQIQLFLTSTNGQPWIAKWNKKRKKRQEAFIAYFNQYKLDDLPCSFPKNLSEYEVRLMAPRNMLHGYFEMNKLATCVLFIKSKWINYERLYKHEALMSTCLTKDGEMIDRVIKQHIPPASMVDSKMLVFDQNGDPDCFRQERLEQERLAQEQLNQTITWNGLLHEAIAIGWSLFGTFK